MYRLGSGSIPEFFKSSKLHINIKQHGLRVQSQKSKKLFKNFKTTRKLNMKLKL